MNDALITGSAGILFVLAGNAALWFFLEKRTGWKLLATHPPPTLRAASHNRSVRSVGASSVVRRVIVSKSPKRIFTDTVRPASA